MITKIVHVLAEDGAAGERNCPFMGILLPLEPFSFEVEVPDDF